MSDQPTGELVELAKVLDRLGYTTLWLPESWGKDAFVLLACLGAATSCIHLGSAVVNVSSRSPAALAQAIATLDEASGGRAVLGLGVSSPRVIQDWHGLAWDRPLNRLKETTEIVRLILSGERVNFEGRIFHLRDFRLRFKPQRQAVRICWGVYSARSIRAAGRYADGWLSGEMALTDWPAARAEFVAGAEAAGRAAPQTLLIQQVLVCDTEAQLAHGKALARRDLAFRLGGMGPYHRRALAGSQFADIGDHVAALWAAGKRAEAEGALPDGLLARSACIGSVAEVRAHLRHVYAASVDEPVINVPTGTPRDRIMATLDACAPRSL